MQTHRLGSDGPELSVIGYGAWEAGGTNWGPNESDDAVIAAIHAALEAGINWIDTAEVYGEGVSELIRRCGERGTGVVAYGPLAFGMLSGTLTRESVSAFTDWRAGWDEGVFSERELDRSFTVVHALRGIADRLGVTPSQLALAWV